MSSKRSSQFQITKDGTGQDDSREEETELRTTADPATMARRVIAKPKSRLDGRTASKPVFSNGPSNTFSSQLQTTNNTFGFASSASKTPAVDVKKAQIYSLNTVFLKKINDMVSENKVADFSPMCEKYINYVKDINAGKFSADIPSSETKSNGLPLESSNRPSETAQLFSSTGNTSTAAQSETSKSTNVKPFSFSKPDVAAGSEQPSKKPEVSFSAPTSQTSTDKPFAFQSTGFSFGTPSANPFKISSPSAVTPVESEAKANKDTTEKKDNTKEADSNGPKVSFVPKVVIDKDSPFQFSSPADNSQSSNVKPSPFVFKSDGNSSSGFKLDKPTTEKTPAKDSAKEKTESTNEAPKSDSKPAFSFGTNFSGPQFGFQGKSSTFGKTDAAKDLTWKPDGKISFGGTAESKSNESSTPASTDTTEDSKASAKPLFSFGAASNSTFGKPSEPSEPSEPSNEAASSDGAKAKPVFGGSTGFSFSNPGTSSPFSFKPPANSSSTAPPASNATGGIKPFSFGSTDKPSFSFTAPKPAATTEQQPSQTEEHNDGNDAEENIVLPTEPHLGFAEKGPGEENEDVSYEHKVKLYLVDTSKSQPFEAKGVGILRVLVHKETKKARALVRAEGSGRVLLNTVLKKEITYSKMGEKIVRVPSFTDGAIETFACRVKEVKDADALLDSLETNKS